MIVWIASYPRSGNTLLRMILKQAFRINSYSKYNDINDIGNNAAMADAVGHLTYYGSWLDFYKHASASNDIYFVKTHDHPVDNHKAVYIIRDGRAASVSYKHYLDKYAEIKRTLPEIIFGCAPFGAWGEHVDAWLSPVRDNVLVLRYEDIISNSKKALGQIAEHLDIKIAGMYNSDFEKLHMNYPDFFRSGSNEKNIEEMNESCCALFEILHGQALSRYDYKNPNVKAAGNMSLLEPALKELQLATTVTMRNLYSLRTEVTTLRQNISKIRESNEAGIRELKDKLLCVQNSLAEQKNLAEYRLNKINSIERELTGNVIDIIRARRRIIHIKHKNKNIHNKSVNVAANENTCNEEHNKNGIPEIYRNIPAQTHNLLIQNLGIAVFAFNRPRMTDNLLASLGQQNALKSVHVFIDGDQGRPSMRGKINEVENIVKKYPVAGIHRRNGSLGFRKMILQAMSFMLEKYKYLIFLEDDCFPIRNCIEVFRNELEYIRDKNDIFSVYGHHFNVPGEHEIFARFQGWGWATTREKLKPVLADLIQCYWMREDKYLAFTKEVLTDDILKRIDITPGRQPSITLRKFFAWDETICLLTALRGQMHKKTSTRVVYNCGIDDDSSHFGDYKHYRKPPFNMVSVSEVWKYF